MPGARASDRDPVECLELDVQQCRSSTDRMTPLTDQDDSPLELLVRYATQVDSDACALLGAVNGDTELLEPADVADRSGRENDDVLPYGEGAGLQHARDHRPGTSHAEGSIDAQAGREVHAPHRRTRGNKPLCENATQTVDPWTRERSDRHDLGRTATSSGQTSPDVNADLFDAAIIDEVSLRHRDRDHIDVEDLEDLEVFL